MIETEGRACPNCNEDGMHYGGSWMGHIPEERQSWVREFLKERGFTPCPPAKFSGGMPLPNRYGNSEDAGL